MGVEFEKMKEALDENRAVIEVIRPYNVNITEGEFNIQGDFSVNKERFIIEAGFTFKDSRLAGRSRTFRNYEKKEIRITLVGGKQIKTVT